MECGIYQIVCKTTGKRYIGSTYSKRGFEGRWNEHKNDLINNKHHCQYLQNAWNKYGEDDFLFLIMDILPRDKVICHKYEQMYFDTVDPETLFNCKLIAAGGNGGANKGKTLKKHPPRTEEQLVRIREAAQKRKGVPQSQETIAKKIASMTGLKRDPYSSEHKEKMSIGVKKSWANGDYDNRKPKSK